MNFRIVYLLFLVTFLFVGCTESVDPKPYTFSQIITGKTSKTWRVDRLIFRQQGKEDENLGLSTCEKDDLYKFYANEEKLFEVDNGNVACSSEEGDGLLVSYVWEFNQAKSSLTMVAPHIFGYFIIPFIIKDVSARSMELEVFLDEDATVSYVLMMKLVDEE
jgi:hypothetical protein